MPSLKKLAPGMGPLAYFGNELRKHREATGQTQAQVGDVVGYTDSYIGMFERGERPPGPALLKALDKHFCTIGIFERMTEILATHTGQTVSRIASDIDRDFVLRGEDAKAYGMIDHVIDHRELKPVTAITA